MCSTGGPGFFLLWSIVVLGVPAAGPALVGGLYVRRGRDRPGRRRTLVAALVATAGVALARFVASGVLAAEMPANDPFDAPRYLVLAAVPWLAGLSAVLWWAAVARCSRAVESAALASALLTLAAVLLVPLLLSLGSCSNPTPGGP